jgi:hypothetical protein
MNVSRERSLPYPAAALVERPLQVFLAGHRPLLYDLKDGLLSGKLGHKAYLSIVMDTYSMILASIGLSS